MLKRLKPVHAIAMSIALVAAACAQSPLRADTAPPASSAASSEAPPLENGVYVAHGICFGEWGCDYSHWRAAEPIALHERPDPASPVIANVPRGAWLTALEGQLRFIPLRGVVRTATDTPQNVRLEVSDVVYMLEPQGEGYYTFWRRGARFGSTWIEGEDDEPITWDAPAAPLPGAVTGQWRRFRTESGQTGWAEGGQYECMSDRSGDEGCRG